MKTLITTLAVLALSFTNVIAKDGTFTTVIVKDSDNPSNITIGSHQWIKILNFVQNNGDTEIHPAGLALFKNDTVMWILFATGPSVANAAVVIEGPGTIGVRFSADTSGASALLTYQRGSD